MTTDIEMAEWYRLRSKGKQLQIQVHRRHGIGAASVQWEDLAPDTGLDPADTYRIKLQDSHVWAVLADCGTVLEVDAIDPNTPGSRGRYKRYKLIEDPEDA